MVFNWEEGWECDICVCGWGTVGAVSEFKYLGCVLNESSTDESECHIKVASWRKVASSIRSLANARSMQLECESVLHEGLLMPALLHGT